ncbi:uncharacterized protein LOC116303699 isoform X2 [Actinia tenebrosa]|uniref:Uncharacterized protein LOC116303699 isoform X2 n=1 Tax=Actinia tenebrosa TaxID=6105 RepID=A0A6P8IQ04_ACTTE|nr:uncharacterized protein LOC116303699 isoform X2 [Actinia tenebrosa]
MNGLKSFFGSEVEKLPRAMKDDGAKRGLLSKSSQNGQNDKPSLRHTLSLTFLFVVSLMILVFLWISRKRRRWSFIYQTRHLKALPVLCCYVIHISINEYYSNGYKNTSGGPEVLQLGLASSPLMMILSYIWFHEKAHASLVTVFVTLVSLILVVLYCSENDPYIPFQFTFSHGIFGLIHGLSLAIFVLTSKNYLTVQEMSVSQLIHSINIGCVLFLPFVILFNGEIDLLIANGLSSHGGFYNVFLTALILALLRIFDQIASFYHIKNVSSLLHIPARNFAWVPATLAITFSLKMELLVSTFLGFWMVSVIFIAVLVENITEINS